MIFLERLLSKRQKVIEIQSSIAFQDPDHVWHLDELFGKHVKAEAPFDMGCEELVYIWEESGVINTLSLNRKLKLRTAEPFEVRWDALEGMIVQGFTSRRLKQ